MIKLLTTPFLLILMTAVFLINCAIIPIENPFEAVAFEVKGRLRLIQELGRHWSILMGEECFQVIDENLMEMTRILNEIHLQDKDITKNIARIVCDNDELYNSLVDQLVIEEVNEGKQLVGVDFFKETYIELVYSFKLKLREYWTGVLFSFNEVMSELNIKQVKNLLNDEESVIEAMSVRIDLVSRRPEYKTAKHSIKKWLQKHKG